MDARSDHLSADPNQPPLYNTTPPTHTGTQTRQAPPEVRLSTELLGPLRREFRFLSDVVAKYYSTVDRTIDGAVHAVSGGGMCLG